MPYSDHLSSVSPPRIASNATFDLNPAPNARPFPMSFPPVSKDSLAHFQDLFSISISGLNLLDKLTCRTPHRQRRIAFFKVYLNLYAFYAKI